MSSPAKIVELNTQRAPNRVRSEWKEIDPHLATKWLEGNVHNRKVRDSVVQRYAADMAAGRWKQTHQGIAFDEEGVLIDGQHRLFAIIEAQTTVLMQVTYGLPMDSQIVVDDGLARTVVDILRVSNEAMSGMSALHSACAGRMMRGFSHNSKAKRFTRQEQALFLNKHWEAIRFACTFPSAMRIKGVQNAGTLAAIARAFYHEDRAMLARFIHVMAEGLSTDPEDFAAVKLRNWLVSHPGGGSDHQLECYAKTERVIQLFCQRKDVGRNLNSITEELYPLPSGKGDR